MRHRPPLKMLVVGLLRTLLVGLPLLLAAASGADEAPDQPPAGVPQVPAPGPIAL